MELFPGFYKDIVDKDEKLIYPFVSGIEIDILHDKSWNYVESKVRRKFKEGIDQFEQTTGGLFVISKELWEKQEEWIIAKRKAKILIWDSD